MTRKESFIHPLADVKNPNNIGDGTYIWQFCVVLEKAAIGSNCNINALCLIENDVKIGDDVTVKSGVQLWDGLRVSDKVFIGPNVTFVNDIYPRSKKRLKFKKTYIHNNSSIGANATILGGVSIGKYSLIGAGSVVTKNVSPYALVVGNPSKQIGWVCKCGNKAKDTRCTSCKISMKDIARELEEND
tara:strand:- start:1072 stop:1632 length:561 start_codon:yes stop_codon:yes gene_type:complete